MRARSTNNRRLHTQGYNRSHTHTPSASDTGTIRLRSHSLRPPQQWITTTANRQPLQSGQLSRPSGSTVDGMTCHPTRLHTQCVICMCVIYPRAGAAQRGVHAQEGGSLINGCCCSGPSPPAEDTVLVAVVQCSKHCSSTVSNTGMPACSNKRGAGCLQRRQVVNHLEETRVERVVAAGCFQSSGDLKSKTCRAQHGGDTVSPFPTMAERRLLASAQAGIQPCARH